MNRVSAAILLLALVLAVPMLAGCRSPAVSAQGDLLALAERVPADVNQAFLLDLKPAGDMGRRWTAFRERLVTTSSGKQLLDGVLGSFRLDKLDLIELASGPAVTGEHASGTYTILEVSDNLAAMEALLHYDGLDWEQEPFDDRTLYHARDPRYEPTQRHLAWTLDGNLLLLCQVHQGDALEFLKTLLGLPQGDSLAALPAWKTLIGRLPANPLGVFFLNASSMAERNPPNPGEASVTLHMLWQMEAVAMAVFPGEQAMRVDIAGLVRLRDDAPPQVRTLLTQEPLDAAIWDHMPVGTALAVAGRDAPSLWPIVAEGFNLRNLTMVRDALGLDIEADLMASGGPLARSYAVAVTPPLAEQPISKEVMALQVLFAAPDASLQHMDPLRAAMENRGAVFAPTEVEEVPLQVQVGTGLSGYAVAYGVHDDTLLLGSSPAIVGQSVAAARDRSGLLSTDLFQTVSASWPERPTLAFYVNHERLSALLRSNMTTEQYQNGGFVLLAPFQATGLALRLQADRLDGTLYVLLN